MEGNNEGVPTSQILITFKGEKSIEFDIQLTNVAVSQMLLAAQWLEIRSKTLIEATERARQARLARLNDPSQQILVPGIKTLRGD